MPILYIRKRTARTSSGPHSGFDRHQKYTEYRDAVFAGQDLAGFGNFYVDTGDRVPSREEQLCEEPKPKRTKSFVFDENLVNQD